MRYARSPELDHRSGGDDLSARSGQRFLCSVDERSVAGVTSFAANSTEVAKRINEYYSRDAEVIHPPVGTSCFNQAQREGGYLLCASRFVACKRHDLALESSTKLDLPRVVAGSGPGEYGIRSLAESIHPGRVEFVTRPCHEHFRALVSAGSAFVFPGNEDFGIIVSEAIAAGAPVVTLNEGVTMTQSDSWGYSLDRAQRGARVKVVLVVSRADVGGGTEHMYQLANGLVNRGHEVFAALPREAPYWRRTEELLGVGQLHEIPKRSITPPSAWSLRQWMQRIDPSVVHTHGRGAGTIGRIAAMGLAGGTVHTFHGVHMPSGSRLNKWVYVAFERLASTFTDYTIAVSKSEACEILPLVRKSRRVAVVHNGVVCTEGSFATAPLPPEPLSGCTVLRYNRQKNPEDAFRIAKQLRSKYPKFTLKVACVATDASALQGYADQCGAAESVEILGELENCRPMYLGSHFYLSTSRWEGLPLAPLEAMSCGLPVVLSDVVGNVDLSQCEGVKMYTPGDMANAIAQIDDIVSTPDVWRVASAASVDCVRTRFGVEAMVDETESIYRSVT